VSGPEAAAAPERPPLEVLIVGAGFSGLCLGARLARAGAHSFLILEKAEEVGGTWRDNTYPGCACDVPSHLYSLSFAPRAEWTRLYPSWTELLDYLKGFVRRFGLQPHLRLGVEMTGAEWDAEAALWRVTTQRGETISARTLVSAVGALHTPDIPRLPGIETFEGPAFHSARWRHDVSLKGKRVAVVGTGASALQFAPEIAPEAERLYVFQRTAPWVLPKLDRRVGRLEQALRRRLPGFARAHRLLTYWRFELRALAMKGNQRLLDKVEALGRNLLERQVQDPGLRARLTPGFRVGCKRILLSNDWYPMFSRPNVELVTAAVREVRPHAVVDAEGVERPVDVLIWGTGFSVTEALRRLPVRALGRTLDEAWSEQVRSLYGVSVEGFPNFFLMLGPNTGLGHNSQLIMIEAQADHIVSALRLRRRRKAAVMAPRAEAVAAFDAGLQAALARSVWQTGGCRSWYQDAAGRNPTVWPGFTFDYRRRAGRARAQDYAFAAPAAPGN
jgi:cation diffusion facilitator CzcD-associated flavoprotein CzcO